MGILLSGTYEMCWNILSPLHSLSVSLTDWGGRGAAVQQATRCTVPETNHKSGEIQSNCGWGRKLLRGNEKQESPGKIEGGWHVCLQAEKRTTCISLGLVARAFSKQIQWVMHNGMEHTVANDKHNKDFPSFIFLCHLHSWKISTSRAPLGRGGTNMNVLLEKLQEQISIDWNPCGVFPSTLC